MTGWRPALRIARRNAWHHKVRSLLVLLLVAIPAFAGTLIAVTYQTGQVSVEDSWKSQFGSADLGVWITVPGDNGVAPPYTAARAQHDLSRIRSMLPTGSTVIANATQPSLAVSNGDRVVDVLNARAADMTDPMNTGLFTLANGRWPAGTDEIALSRADLDQLDINIGQRVAVTVRWNDADGRPMQTTTTPATVVGVIDEPSTFRPNAMYLQAPQGPIGSQPELSYYSGVQARIVLPPGESATAVALSLNDSEVTSQTPQSRVGYENSYGSAVVSRLAATGIAVGGLLSVATIIGFVVIVLLAGAAFAAGARRMQRDLALVSVTGGSPQQLRLMVLGEGLVLGVCAAMLGFVVALATFIGIRAPLAELIGMRLDRAIVISWPVLGVALASVTASVAAAWFSARRVARMKPTVAVHGDSRTGARRAHVPKLATSAFAIGLVGSVVTLVGIDRLRALAGLDFSSPWLWSAHSEDQSKFAAFFVLMLLGLVALVPQLLALLAQHCGSLPLLPRLAMRDAARSRHRSAPVVAAVLAVTTMGVGALIVAAGFDTQRKGDFLASTPTGMVTASLNGFSSPEAQGQVPTALAHLRQAVSPTAEYLVRGTGVEIINECPPNPDAGMCSTSPVSVADPTMIMRLAAVGTNETTLRQHLDAGGVVVFDTSKSTANDRTFDGFGTLPARITNGQVRAFENDLDPRTAQTANLPVLVLEPREDTQMITMVFGSDRAVASVPMPSLEPPTSASDLTAVYTIGYPMTNSQIEGMNSALAPYQLAVDAHRTFVPKAHGISVAIAVLAGLIAVLATSAAAALAIVEQRADMAILRAMGTSPRRQRQLASIQSALLATLGVGLGIALGIYLGASATDGTWFPVVIPGDQIAAIGIGVPLLAAAVAWLCTAREANST